MFTTGLRCEECDALKRPIPPPPPPSSRPERDAGHLPVAGLLAGSAVLSVVQVLFLSLLSPGALSSPLLLGCVCASGVAALAASFGAYLAFIGDNWDLTLWCSIASIFTIGPLFLASLLGVVAVILVATGRHRFYA